MMPLNFWQLLFLVSSGLALVSSTLIGFNADIDILSGTGPQGFNSYWTFANGFSAKGTKPIGGKCFSSKSRTNNEAFFDILLSQVAVVYLKNRGEKEHSHRMAGNKVEVCTKGAQCTECGIAPDTGAGAWARIECTSGAITGNQVKVSRMDEYLAFCEVDIRGKKIHESIGILGGVSSEPWSYGWDLTMGYTKAGEVPTPESCFCTKYAIDSYVFLDIPLSEVAYVQLLNRNDKYSILMEGMSVHVCDHFGTCNLCGVTTATAKATWTTVDCSGVSFTANKIKITSEKQISFCEIEVIGTPMVCSSSCGDYHRFCPGLTDPGFAAQYQQLIESGALDNNIGTKVPPEATCENQFYKTMCPKSCKMCRAC